MECRLCLWAQCVLFKPAFAIMEIKKQTMIDFCEPEFLNFYGAQESIPWNQFRQPMWPVGPVR